MENNEENLNSQEPSTEPSTNSSSATTTNTNNKLLGIIAVAVVIILALFFMLFTRSPKSTVKDYIKSFEKCNAKKAMSVVDFEGTLAFRQIKSPSYSSGSYEVIYDFEKFDDEYKEVLDVDKDKKKEYKEAKEDATDSLQDKLDTLKDFKVKYSIKDMKTEKVDGSKKITKVTCTLVLKHEDDKMEQDVTFYTMKKGLKNYIVDSDGM